MKFFVAALLFVALVDFGHAKRSIWWKKNAVSAGGTNSNFQDEVLDCLAEIKEDVQLLQADMKKMMAKLGRLIQSGTAFEEFNNHTYSFIKAESNWEDAKTECESIGENAHLLIIDSIEELEFVRSELGITTEAYWIGMTDEEVEDDWKWTDGTILAADIAEEWFGGFEDGSSLQPNGETEQNCGQLRSEFIDIDGNFKSAGKVYLNDFYCNSPGLTAYRICEVDVPPKQVYEYYYG